MSPINIAAVPQRSEVLAGELLLVTTTLTNAGPEPISLPDPAFEPPYTYELLDPNEDRRVVYTASRASYDAAQLGDDVDDELETETITLKPGENATVTEDLVEYVAGGFAPGEYLLVASVTLSGETSRSEPVELRILAPRASLVRTIVCPAQQVVGAVFDHREDDGSVTLLQAETLSEEPESLVFRRRVELPGAIDDLALSVHVAPGGEGRWFAWLADGKFAAARGWVSMVAGRAEPTALDLENAMLANPGFGISAEGALFIVAGENDSGAVVRFLRVSPKGVLAGPPAALTQVLPERILTAISRQKVGPRLHLVYAEQAKSTTRILARDYDLKGGALDDAPRELLTIDAPLLGLRMEPFVPGRILRVSTLSMSIDSGDPKRSVPQLVCHRVPVAGGVAEEWSIPDPDLPISRWAFTDPGENGPAVAALYGDTLLICRVAETREWTTFAGDVRTTARLKFLTTKNQGTWLEWVDTVSGFTHRRVDPR